MRRDLRFGLSFSMRASKRLGLNLHMRATQLLRNMRNMARRRFELPREMSDRHCSVLVNLPRVFPGEVMINRAENLERGNQLLSLCCPAPQPPTMHAIG